MKTTIFYGLLLVFFLSLFSIQTVFAIECCIDADTLECQEGTDLGCSEPPDQVFDGICAAVPNNLCTAGCCCANPTAINPDQWNNDEEAMNMNGAQCGALGSDYTFQTRGPGESCVDVCFGAVIEPPTNRYTVEGTVTDSEGNPLDLATVYVPNFGAPTQDTTGADGTYEITNIPEIQTAYVIATREGCRPTSQEITLDRNLVVDIEMNCNANACEPQSVPTVSATILRGTDSAQLLFTADTSCGEPEYYDVIRVQLTEDGDDGPAQVIGPITAQEHTDSGLLSNTEYCYRVAAKYLTGLYPEQMDERQEACITTGDEVCMHNPPEDLEWCRNGEDAAVLACDENNMLIEESCPGDMICSTAGGQASCVEEPACEKCNGLFGMLNTIVHTIFRGAASYDCGTSPLANFCYVDRTPTVSDAYVSCAQTTTCEDYLSTAACGDNPCGVSDDCSWSTIFEETGTGICQSTEQTPDCGACEDIFGTCSQTLCTAISSECYYDGLRNGLTEYRDSFCRHKDEMACRFYDNENDCTNTGNNVRIDVAYTGDERSAGSNRVQISSNDALGFGVCGWNAAGNRCYKDADGRKDTEYPEDDCIENGVYDTQGINCLIDREPPETDIVLAGTTLGTHELGSLDYVTRDNHYLRASDIDTWFCLDEQNSCYPTGSLSSLVAEIPDMEINEERTLYLRYYSADPSGNLEEVQSQELTLIELGIPRIEDAEIIR